MTYLQFLENAIKDDKFGSFLLGEDGYGYCTSDPGTHHPEPNLYLIEATLREYISKGEVYKSIIQNEVLKELKNYRIDKFKNIVEIIHFDLTCIYPIGIVNEQILNEVQKVAREHLEELRDDYYFNIEKLDNSAYNRSGKHLL